MTVMPSEVGTPPTIACAETVAPLAVRRSVSPRGNRVAASRSRRTWIEGVR